MTGIVIFSLFILFFISRVFCRESSRVAQQLRRNIKLSGPTQQ
jgi:hypothetical protein